MSRRLATAVCFALFFASARAAAQNHPDPEIVPPVAAGDTEVPYPAGGRGDAVVVLDIVVEKDGSVSRAEVTEGVPPFAEHARAAVLSWRFVPARRGDLPIRVRTRARVEFHREIEAPPAANRSSPSAPVTKPPPPEEVTVRGPRREIGRIVLSASDVRQMPGAFGDPFRAIDALPGVVPMISGLPYFFVRGAPPNNAGYFLDGIRVPLLFHIGLGPGVIHPELVERVDFHPGAAPVEYGRFAGPIIAGETRAPSTRFHGAANLRLVDAGALIEAPFAGDRGSALVAGRYGYPGPVVSTFSDTTLDYWDYQSRASWRAADRDTFSIFAFGSHDTLAHVDKRTRATVEDFSSDFHRIDLRFDRKLEGGHARVAATVGYDTQGASPTFLTNWSGAIRAQLERPLFGELRFRAGADARIDAYSFEQRAPIQPEEPTAPSGVDPPPTNVAWGAHADVVWPLAPRVEIVPGARVDVFESTRRSEHTRVPAVDPRFAARVRLTRSLTFVSAIGLAHQYPTLRVGNLPAPVVSGFGFPSGTSQLQTVAQASEGFELALPAEITVAANAFLSGWTGLTDLSANCIQIEPPVLGPAPALEPGGDPNGPRRPQTPYTCPNEGPVHGRAYGAEVLVRRALSKRLGGWLSYTLSRSTREARFVRLDGGTTTATVPSDFDRTHVLNAILAYDLGRRWRAGTRFALYSGAPYSRLEGSVPVPPYNAERDPPFLRLDVRLEKRWPFAKDGSIAFVVEGQNVTLGKERSSLGVDCIGRQTPDGGTNECQRAEIGPITLASIGVEAFF